MCAHVNRDILEKSTNSDEVLACVMSALENPQYKFQNKQLNHKHEHRKERKKKDVLDDTKPIVKECVSKWLFKESSDVKKPVTLYTSEAIIEEKPEVKEKGFKDDGSFPDDPVLKILRKKLSKYD